MHGIISEGNPCMVPCTNSNSICLDKLGSQENRYTKDKKASNYPKVQSIMHMIQDFIILETTYSHGEAKSDIKIARCFSN